MEITIEQYEQLSELIRCIEENQCEPEQCCWLVDEHGNDSDDSYCYDCIKSIVPEPEYGENFSRAGYAFDYDNPQRCEACGKVLDYTLTDYGIEMELDHWSEYPPENFNDRRECFELARVAGGLSTDEQRLKLLTILLRAQAR